MARAKITGKFDFEKKLSDPHKNECSMRFCFIKGENSLIIFKIKHTTAKLLLVG